MSCLLLLRWLHSCRLGHSGLMYAAITTGRYRRVSQGFMPTQRFSSKVLLCSDFGRETSPLHQWDPRLFGSVKWQQTKQYVIDEQFVIVKNKAEKVSCKTTKSRKVSGAIYFCHCCTLMFYIIIVLRCCLSGGWVLCTCLMCCCLAVFSQLGPCEVLPPLPPRLLWADLWWVGSLPVASWPWV